MKRVISVLLCAMMLLCEVSLTHAEEFPYVAFATVNLRLRRAPGADASVLTVIKAGEAVIVSGAVAESPERGSTARSVYAPGAGSSKEER